MKKTLLILSLVLSFSVYSEVALQFNIRGEFIPPDVVLQERGLKAYEKGFLKSSKADLKKSAKFGNDRSKYLLALLNIQNNNWVKAYAWLKLINGSMQSKDELMKEIESTLSKTELAESTSVFKELKKDYNDKSSFKRRNKWERSLQGTGSHISGIDTMKIKRYKTNMPITSFEFKKQVHSYVHEYKSRGLN